MVRSSSIFTALPNMKMYCMRFENSHIFRSRSSMLVSAMGSDDSISARSRLREPILSYGQVDVADECYASGFDSTVRLVELSRWEKAQREERWI